MEISYIHVFSGLDYIMESTLIHFINIFVQSDQSLKHFLRSFTWICLSFIFILCEKCLLTLKIILLIFQPHPWLGSSTLHQYRISTVSRTYCTFSASGSLHMLGLHLRLHVLAWKMPMQYSLKQLKNILWSILSLQLEGSNPHLGPNIFCINYYPNSHVVFSYLLSFLIPTRFYEFIEGRDYVSIMVNSQDMKKRSSVYV